MKESPCNISKALWPGKDSKFPRNIDRMNSWQRKSFPRRPALSSGSTLGGVAGLFPGSRKQCPERSPRPARGRGPALRPLAAGEVSPAPASRLAAARGGGAAGHRPEEGPGPCRASAAPLPEVGTSCPALPGAPGVSERCPLRGAARSPLLPLPAAAPVPFPAAPRGFSPPARRPSPCCWRCRGPSDARVCAPLPARPGRCGVERPRGHSACGGGRGMFPALQAWNAEVSFTFQAGYGYRCG